jgi:hypothetical protein
MDLIFVGTVEMYNGSIITRCQLKNDKNETIYHYNCVHDTFKQFKQSVDMKKFNNAIVIIKRNVDKKTNKEFNIKLDSIHINHTSLSSNGTEYELLIDNSTKSCTIAFPINDINTKNILSFFLELSTKWNTKKN